MPKKYIDQPFGMMDGEDTASAEVSLVGSHLQNICIEIENDGVDVSVMFSPGGARRLIAALQVALDEIQQKI